jgi:hypothetical protein
MHMRLTPEEDAELRRLAALAAYGELGERPTQLYAELRGRDRRRSVRPVHSLAVPLPREPHADGPRATPAY